MDNLEQFIKSEREAFDNKEPREKLWSRIESDLDSRQDRWGWIWKAAVLVLIPLCGFLLWERGQNDQLAQDFPQTDVFVDPEFEETELYYSQLISQKKGIIEQFQVEDPNIKESFKLDISALDSLYLELKTELIETGNTAVLEAMVNNLQLRMELLNQQLMILEQIEHDNNEKQPTKIS